MMVKYKINLSKVDKKLLLDGEQGVWLFGAMFENREGTNQYGNNGFIVQDVSKEDREAGKKGPIIGNWSYVKKKETPTETNESGEEETPRFKHELPM
jgi:hypothetical protein